MGNWSINIEGIGAHHNTQNTTDANRMACDFVATLRKAGHTVTHSTFTFGGCDSLDCNVTTQEVRDSETLDDGA